MGAITSTCEIYSQKMHPSNNLSGHSGCPPELYQLVEHYDIRRTEDKNKKVAKKVQKEEKDEHHDKIEFLSDYHRLVVDGHDMSTSNSDLKNYKMKAKKRYESIGSEEEDEEEEDNVPNLISPSPTKAKAKKKAKKEDDENIDELLQMLKKSSEEREAKAQEKVKQDQQFQSSMLSLLQRIADKPSSSS